MNAAPVVLLVEDESLVSLLAEDILIEAGFRVLLAMRQQDGLALAKEEAIDFAVLDVNLGGGETSYPIARTLAERNIPFLFATGYDAGGLDPDFRACDVLRKPYTPRALLRRMTVKA